MVRSKAQATFYDVEADPGELENVVGQHPEIVARLQKKLANWYGEGRRTEMHWGAAIHAGRTAAPAAEELLSALVTDWRRLRAS